MADPAEVRDRALQLGGPGSVPEVTDGDLFKLPVYEEDFSGGYWVKASGKVILRYPTFGDEVEIERLSVMRGGTILARAQATLLVCLQAAPSSWWRANPAPSGDPLPAVDRLPCSVEIVGLFQRWLNWRDSFRVPDAGTATESTQ